MISRKNTLFDQGMNCVTFLMVGIINAPFLSRELRNKLWPWVLMALILLFFVSLFLTIRRDKEETAREQRDERSRMIQEKSVWYCHIAEDWVLLGLFVWFGIFMQRDDLAYTVWWLLLGRYVVCFGIRWWLNRKY